MIAVVLFALLSVFPRHYLGTVRLAPQDANSAGLSGIMASLGANFAALLGNHQPVEINLTIGRSHELQQNVVKRLHLVGRPGFRNADQALLKLRRIVDVRTLRGGILEIQVVYSDRDFTEELANGYAAAFQERITELTRQQNAYKRSVLQERLGEAVGRLAKAEAAMDNYRANNKLAQPESQLGAAVNRLNALQATLQAKAAELQTTLKFATEDNIQVKTIRAEMAAIQRQIDQTHSQSIDASGLTLKGISAKSTEYLTLYRNLKFAEVLFESYKRYMEGVALEDLSAASNMQIIEPAFVDPAYKFNIWAVAMLALTILLAIVAEFYVPPSRRAEEIKQS